MSKKKNTLTRKTTIRQRSGPKPAITQDVVDKYKRCMLAGLDKEKSYRMVGVPETTIRAWIRAGEEDSNNKQDTLFAKLYRADVLEDVEIEAELTEVMHETVRKGDGRLAFDILKAKRPHKYGGVEMLKLQQLENTEKDIKVNIIISDEVTNNG